MNKNKTKFFQIVFLGFFIVLIVFCILFFIFTFSKLHTKAFSKSALGVQRDYSVLVTGSSSNEAFLKQVYEGASIVSNFYDSATQYYVPEIKVENNSFQSLAYYAGFTNSDCVITYLDSDFENAFVPRTIDGSLIPLVTVGYYSPDVPKLFHIGIDYEELGLKMAEEAIKYFNGKEGILYILNVDKDKNQSNKILFDSLSSRLVENSNIQIQYSTVKDDNKVGGFSLEDEVRQQIASLGKIDLILALSEQNTLLAVQTVLDLNVNAQTKIIGFGEGQESLTSLKKGFVLELFSADAVDIGKKAMQHFFEYKTNGTVDNFVLADLKILKAE